MSDRAQSAASDVAGVGDPRPPVGLEVGQQLRRVRGDRGAQSRKAALGHRGLVGASSRVRRAKRWPSFNGWSGPARRSTGAVPCLPQGAIRSLLPASEAVVALVVDVDRIDLLLDHVLRPARTRVNGRPVEGGALAVDHRVGQVGALEEGVVEVSTRQVGLVEVGPDQVRALQLGSCQVGPLSGPCPGAGRFAGRLP